LEIPLQEVMMSLVTKYGRMWARNDQNFKKLAEEDKLKELYILYDGSMPVYVGHGWISTRLERARKSKTRGRFWDYFSWYAIPDEELQKDAEALIIKTLPYYLRLLNRKNESFDGPKRSVKQSNKVPEAVDKPKFAKVRKVG
jgi:hypothetical protein